MQKSDKEFFQELISKIPKETSILVEKQMDIAVAIGEAIKKTGMTKKEFAKEIGMKESYISRVCAGNVNLTLKTIAKFEAALDDTFIQVPMFVEKVETKVLIVRSDDYVYPEDILTEEDFNENVFSNYKTNQNILNIISTQHKDCNFNKVYH